MAKKANVLLIITDQLRYDSIGINNAICKTPNIDRLAHKGMSFGAITPCPLCSPARTAIFTGKYPHQVRGKENTKRDANDPLSVDTSTMLPNNNVADAEPVFPQLLKKAGYQTMYAGKWHMGNEIIHEWWDKACGYDTQEYSKWCADNGFEDGWAFNDYSVRSSIWPHMSNPKAAVMNISPENHGDAWIVDKALDYIKNRDVDRPFFTVCALNGPHPPFKIPEPYFSMFDENDIEEPDNFNYLEGKPEYIKDCYYHQIVKEFSEDFKDWKKSIAVYYGFIKFIDDQIGRLIQCLKDENEYENTLIIFTSDHGEMMGSHGLWHKMMPYEEAVRVPLIFSAPNIKKDLQCDEAVSLLDITPTVLEMAGADGIPEDMQGISLKKLLTENEHLVKRYLFSEHRPLGDFHKAVNWRMITDNEYKFVYNEDDKNEFYHLTYDPKEMKNLVDDVDYVDLIGGYKDRLKQWMADTNDVIPFKEP